MREMPLPVIVVSSLNQDIIEETLEALEHGAVDFILKPTELASEKLYQIQTQLINKVVTIASLKGKTHPSTGLSGHRCFSCSKNHFSASGSQAAATDISPPFRKSRRVCGDRCFYGGPSALYQIIPRLPENFPAGILIVQHMPPGFTKPLAERMNKNSQITVKEAEEGDTIVPDRRFVAPEDIISICLPVGRCL